MPDISIMPRLRCKQGVVMLSQNYLTVAKWRNWLLTRILEVLMWLSISTEMSVISMLKQIHPSLIHCKMKFNGHVSHKTLTHEIRKNKSFYLTNFFLWKMHRWKRYFVQQAYVQLCHFIHRYHASFPSGEGRWTAVLRTQNMNHSTISSKLR